MSDNETTPQYGPTPAGPSADGPTAGVPRSGGAASRFSRRQLLLGTGGGLGALAVGGLAGFELPHSDASASSAGSSTGATKPVAAAPQVTSSVQTFISRPDLQPPSVTLTTYGPIIAGEPAYIFLSVRTYIAGAPGQAGLMILDRQGRLVWFKPITEAPFDFNAQTYQGKAVLTWWQGNISSTTMARVPARSPTRRYITRRSVQAGGGLREDLHELVLTSAGTALITAYETIEGDLSSVGGKSKAQVVSGHAEEIDLATGKLLFDWDCWDHIGANESYVDSPGVGTLRLFPHQLDSRDLRWQPVDLCQEHLRYLQNRQVEREGTVADEREEDGLHDGAWVSVLLPASCPPKWALGYQRVRRRVRSQPQGPFVWALARRGRDGNARQRRRRLPAPRRLRGGEPRQRSSPPGRQRFRWMGQPIVLFGVRCRWDVAPRRRVTDRLALIPRFCNDWAGAPSDAPAIAARSNPAGGTVVYASWNGAVNVARWTVLTGSQESSLTAIGSQQWTGFETVIAVNSGAGYYAVAALDASGKVLGRSATTHA